MPILNSTSEYWDIDGVSLNTFAYNIATIGGSRYDLPPLRGEDSQFAHRPGSEFRPKTVDSRIISLAMWVAGIDPETGNPDPDDQTLRWNDNWNSLRRLVWTPNRQVVLTRRWRLTNPITLEPEIVVASTLAQISNTMTPQMTGRTRADFIVDFKLTDPFFYGSEITSSNIAVAGSQVVNNIGDDAASYNHVYVDFVGPLTKPRLTNTTATPDVWVELSGEITGTVTLDVNNFTISPSSVLLNRASHSGARSWFGLLRGNNSVSLSADAGSGHAVVRFKPPYL